MLGATVVGARAEGKARGNLPVSGRYLLRPSTVVTMEPGEGPRSATDVLVEDGRIVGVGPDLPSRDAVIIEAPGHVLMPGLVETHWHMWTTLLRNLATADPQRSYFKLTAGTSQFFSPDDFHIATMLSAAEALNGGITTVHDWCHNVLSPDHAIASLTALKDAGIRARYSYGPARHRFLEAIDLRDLQMLHSRWQREDPRGLIHLGMGWQGVQFPRPGEKGRLHSTPVSESVWRPELEAARSMGIPLSVHANQGCNGISCCDEGHIAALEKLGLLGADIQIVHGLNSRADEIAMLAAAGGTLTMSPLSEMRIGYGIPNIRKFVDAGVAAGLSIDSPVLTGSANLFEVMRTTQNLQNGMSQSESAIDARCIIDLATLQGARSLGIADQTGSIKTGKSADLIMIDLRSLAMTPPGDLFTQIVNSTQPGDVSLVMIAGRVLKRNGMLTDIDVPGLRSRAVKSQRNILARAGI